MNRIDRYIHITETATHVGHNWTNVEVMKFHYFNPNGLYARKRANDQHIAALAAAGIVKPGWNLAYGTFASYEADQVSKLATQKRVRGVDMQVAVDMLREHCERQEEKLAEVEPKEGSSDNEPSYSNVRKDPSLDGDSNFCVPVALALISGKSVGEINDSLLAKGRRKFRQCVQAHAWKNEMRDMGIQWIDVTKQVQASGATTVRNVIEHLPRNKKYLVQVRHHLLAVINGKVEDWTETRRHRPRMILEIVDNNPPAEYAVNEKPSHLVLLAEYIQESRPGHVYGAKVSGNEVLVIMRKGVSFYLRPLKRTGEINLAISPRKFYDYGIGEHLERMLGQFSPGRYFHTVKLEDEEQVLNVIDTIIDFFNNW